MLVNKARKSSKKGTAEDKDLPRNTRELQKGTLLREIFAFIFGHVRNSGFLRYWKALQGNNFIIEKQPP
jgi:hypothetical protein